MEQDPTNTNKDTEYEVLNLQTTEIEITIQEIARPNKDKDIIKDLTAEQEDYILELFLEQMREKKHGQI